MLGGGSTIRQRSARYIGGGAVPLQALRSLCGGQQLRHARHRGRELAYARLHLQDLPEREEAVGDDGGQVPHLKDGAALHMAMATRFSCRQWHSLLMLLPCSRHTCTRCRYALEGAVQRPAVVLLLECGFAALWGTCCLHERLCGELAVYTDAT